MSAVLPDEILDEQDAAHLREQSLFGIGSLPRPEDFTEKNCTVIPAWWRFRDLPRRKGHGPHLVITSTDASWLGLSNTPALLRGHGAIPADLARKLGAKPDQITILIFPAASDQPAETDQPTTRSGKLSGGTGNTPDGMQGEASRATEESGKIKQGEDPADRHSAASERECVHNQDHSSEQATRYRPSRALTDLVTAIFSTCTFPNCSQPATRCDLDHLQPFGKGGPTCACNLRPACRRHHQLKTSGRWQARPSRPDERFPVGTTIWTTPDGHAHPSVPCLPSGPGWAQIRPVNSDLVDSQILSQALRQALEARESLAAQTNRHDAATTPSQTGSARQHLTREDTMPAAERARLRQERWRKDQQRRSYAPPQWGRRAQPTDRAHHNDGTSTPPRATDRTSLTDRSRTEIGQTGTSSTETSQTKTSETRTSQTRKSRTGTSQTRTSQTHTTPTGTRQTGTSQSNPASSRSRPVSPFSAIWPSTAEPSRQTENPPF